MRKTMLVSLAIGLSMPGAAFAQANALQSGMEGRVSKLPSTRVELDAEGRIKAGYYRLAIIDAGSSNAGKCPRVTFNQKPKATRRAWKNTGGTIASEIFNRNVSWTMTASYQLATPVQGQPIVSKFRLAKIENAEDVACNAVIGEGGAVGHKGFLIPINRNLNNFGAEIPITFNINYSSKADKERIAQLWDLGSYLTSLVVPGAVKVLEQAAPTAEQQIDRLLDQSNAATTTVSLNSLAEGPQSYYLDLGFFHQGVQPGQIGNHGVIMKLEYVASVFLNGEFLKPITRSGPEILRTSVRTAQGDAPIRSLIRDDIYSQLAQTDKTEVFSPLGQSALQDLVTAGLSEIDATVFIAEIARANPNLRDRLWDLTFLSDRNYLLQTVGKEIPSKPIEIPRQQVTLDHLYRDMELFGAMLQSQGTGEHLSAGFADTITLYVEEPFRSYLGLAQPTVNLPKRDAIELLVKGFERGGCYAPRASRRDLLLGARVPLMQVKAPDRVGALVLKTRAPTGTTGTAAVMTFVARGFAAPRTAPLTDLVTITAPRAYTDDVLSELSEARRPNSCQDDWMDPVFAAP